jgi:DNA polymerase-3 subunit beta
VESELRSIGEMARASGLSVSALRFYDGAGILVPTTVDPSTGYRWYADDQLRPARLVAGLRRIQMPLADIGRAVQHITDPAAVRLLLDAHLRRLEDGLVDARRELSRVHALLDPEESTMTRIVVRPEDLAAALEAVRFAVSDDPEVPMLNGVLIEADADGLRLVATDRYRLAVARVAGTELSGPPVALFAPTAFVDEVRARPAPEGPVTLTLSKAKLTIEGYGHSIVGVPLDLDFPDYRRLTGGRADGEPSRVTVDVAALRTALGSAPQVRREHAGVVHELAVLAVDPAGSVRLASEESWAADEAGHVAVNRGYLLEALNAGDPGQLVLELDGPVMPLALRLPNDEDTFSILMPVRH